MSDLIHLLLLGLTSQGAVFAAYHILESLLVYSILLQVTTSVMSSPFPLRLGLRHQQASPLFAWSHYNTIYITTAMAQKSLQ